ncbi:SDR family oxidoreductase [Actinokineospora terrae]|uniref:NADP-dependent 3-hydroxy acid dehydrogenase YdfG n=1 Tax=Actinokineospora terrae TaxID=155974 RepID=A0A1H9XFX8_9PSEU|nr:SDR family oxidoreductase [Actinokineospora terrae]SES45096.1 NADP-dependent 3-hydroxy acid dehydrogenase YdfG [Actinokineospora terrae]
MSGRGGRVAGKVALVTGAARGVGRACALRLAEEGADLVLLDIGVVSRVETVPESLATAGELERTATEARALGRTVVSRLVDVRDGDAIGAAVRAGVAALGSLDIAVPAAGVRSRGTAWEMPEAQWRTMIDINLTGVWQTAKAVAPVMVAQGAGSIVFIGSALAHRAVAGYAHMAAAKHGVAGLVSAFALELLDFGVRVNSVDPGALGPPGPSAADVADAVLFLASEESRYITGTSTVVDRGSRWA